MYRLLLLIYLLFPAFDLLQAAEPARTLEGFVDKVIYIVNFVVPTILSLTLLVLVWGIFKYLTAGANENRVKEGKDVIIYGVLALFVMISFWGIALMIRFTFF